MSIIIKRLERGTEPIAIDELRKEMKLSPDIDENILVGLLGAARNYAEQNIGQTLCHKAKWKVIYKRIVPSLITLPFGPLSQNPDDNPVINFISPSGEQTPATTTINKASGTICIGEAYTIKLGERESLEIEYYAGQESISEDIRQGIMRHVSMLYTNKILSPQQLRSLVSNFYMQHKALHVAN